MNAVGKAVPYLRVSTDDKGQDPSRQMMTIVPWAKANGVELLPEIVDEGTSATKTDPFQRPKFKDAIERAHVLGAKAIVVELPDRFTRRGSRLHSYYKTKLELEHKLKLWCADRTIENQESTMGELIEAVQATGAREKADTMSRQAHEAYLKAIARGQHWGQPRKLLTAAEKAFAAKLRETTHINRDGQPGRKPMGWDAIAGEINKLRGVNEIVTPEVKRRRSVSGATVRRAFRGRADAPKANIPTEGNNLAEGSSPREAA